MPFERRSSDHSEPLSSGNRLAENVSHPSVEQDSECPGGAHRRGGDHACVIAREVIDVGPPAAVENNEEFGLVRPKYADADRVGITHPGPVHPELLRPRIRLVAPGHRLDDQPSILSRGPAVRDYGNGFVEIDDPVHASIIALS